MWSKLLLIAVFVVQPLCIVAQLQKYKGYPKRDPDIRSEFVNPPKGYGNVPFYWWSGDNLNKERLKEQLEILSRSATDGFAVSYIHTDPKVDSVFNKSGHGLYGRTSPGNPPVFSEKWWDIWNWFSGECAQLNLGAGLDDYTVGWVGNGYYPDELDTMSVFKDYQGQLVIDSYSVKKGETFSCPLPDNLLSAVAWPGKIDLSNNIHEKRLTWQAPQPQDYKVFVVYTKSSYVLHPLHGKKLVDVYFERFYDRMDSLGREGMNYFFQDELSYPINMLSWSEDFPEEFQKRKGYDIIPYLPALKEYIGKETPKVRLDYADVLMSLAEERYFEPVYKWHQEKGLIYGCDNLGRGRDPLAYIDYFRAISWYTAPGNDAPSRGSSFLETKVSSSVAHLYHRPRTWLEAFHSMGWGSSGAWLTQQIDHHFIAGGNLVCMHGLYYSTHGGWWEWAPPCFHFRMPYWPHMKKWLEYTERMSYILSQGKHVCDIALMYPTESLQAYPEKDASRVFDLALQLSNKGLDYDFIDYHSLRKAEFKERQLLLSDDCNYRILILADMKALHYTSLLAARDFYRAGGIVLATDDLPVATSRKGEEDEKVDSVLKELFGLTASEALAGKKGEKQTNKNGGVGWYLESGQLPNRISDLLTPDFVPLQGEGKVLHREIGGHDLYMVMNVPKNSECFFRKKGKLELWDATDASIKTYPIIRQTDEGTYVRLKKEHANSYLFVFSPGEPEYEKLQASEQKKNFEIQLAGDWNVRLIPTLNNKWGDFRLPASDELIGAEARSFRFAPEDEMRNEDWTKVDFRDQQWNECFYGYGPQAIETWRDETICKDTLSYSWKYGIWDNPGSQGWHGLKGKVSDGFFLLDKGGDQSFQTFVYADRSGNYQILQDGTKADRIEVDENDVTNLSRLSLQEGWHEVSVLYKDTERQFYKSRTGSFRDTRKRGAVVFLPENQELPVKGSAYSDSIAMKWFYADHLKYDLHKGLHKRWCYRFKSVPGLTGMEFSAYGKDLRIWINGNRLADSCIRSKNEGGLYHYQISLPSILKEVSTIAFSMETAIGYQATLALSTPVRLQTEEGVISAGDWSETGALRFYSGGINYMQQVNLPETLYGKKAVLNLGDIVATCEVKVNGVSAGILLSSPYQLEITQLLKPGKNEIEVLVYSTLANHYQTIPTPYRGDPKAGLIGPVSLLFEE